MAETIMLATKARDHVRLSKRRSGLVTLGIRSDLPCAVSCFIVSFVAEVR